MADKSSIEWTDATWNPITGCSVVSPGCTNCYAMKLAGTRLKHHPSRIGLTTMSKAGPVWNGKVRFNNRWLDQPLRWKKPRMIFVCAHGDLFHEDVPDAWIDKVFAVMALCTRHTFQVLTKRADRMREYCDGYGAWVRVEQLIHEIKPSSLWNGNVYTAKNILDSARPLPNVWLGVSVEDQKRADERIPDLLSTPAAKRFVSYEPALGPVDFSPWLSDDDGCEQCDTDCCPDCPTSKAVFIDGKYDESRPETCWTKRVVLDQIIAGGESGPGARPMHPDWARSARDQCEAAGVPFLFKQWGAWMPLGKVHDDAAQDEFLSYTHDNQFRPIQGKGKILDVDGCDWFDEQAQPPSNCELMVKVGKKAAGRLLDGIEHNGFPDREDV